MQISSAEKNALFHISYGKHRLEAVFIFIFFSVQEKSGKFFLPSKLKIRIFESINMTSVSSIPEKMFVEFYYGVTLSTFIIKFSNKKRS